MKHSIGTPLSQTATKVLFCGGGELGKEVVIELQRFGVEVIVLDRYAHAPAMHVAHRSYVVNMLDGKQLRSIIEREKPHIIVPEIEAIATQALLVLEEEGFTIIPSARAAYITMNRKHMRKLAAEELGLATSVYRFAQTYEEYVQAITEIGFPCIIKPNMSSSGKGQRVIRSEKEVKPAWEHAQTNGRTQTDMVIVESFIPFDFEITLLTVRDAQGNTHFCEPVGHTQIDGDYRESWQPQLMSETALQKAHVIAKTITDALGGRGIFGVELFIKGDDVYFSEVSPRPHDTGMVTLISQNMSEFALHARAILGLPIPEITLYGPSASHALVVQGDSDNVQFAQLDKALSQKHTELRLFGKPNVQGKRRMGVTLSRGTDITDARKKAQISAESIEVML
jgi:phosphoribosylglycinamide formyltransferase 2